ncbi:MAG TPA: complex I NDUFA9 subunit family protein [Nitrospiria bacterium]
MKIFVTGGTGFVGNEVVRQLLAVGYRVRCLVRDPARALQRLPAAVELIQGDLCDPAGYRAALDGCEAVIHLVGIIVEKGGATFELVHAKGTADLVRAAGEFRIKRFVHMSALGSRPDTESRYFRTKHEAEQSVLRSGMKTTIFRPSVIFGPEDHFVNVLAGIIRLAPIIPVIGDGERKVQPIFIGDVASCVGLSVGNPESHGKIYSLGGPKVMTYNQLHQSIAQALGLQKRLAHMPIALAKVGAVLAERLPRPPITREQLILLQEDNICDPSDAIKDFRLELKEFDVGIREYLKPA